MFLFAHKKFLMRPRRLIFHFNFTKLKPTKQIKLEFLWKSVHVFSIEKLIFNASVIAKFQSYSSPTREKIVGYGWKNKLPCWKGAFVWWSWYSRQINGKRQLNFVHETLSKINNGFTGTTINTVCVFDWLIKYGREIVPTFIIVTATSMK